MADILNIGLSALLAQQRALTTTANNIANASTPGYSRQRVELSERASERVGHRLRRHGRGHRRDAAYVRRDLGGSAAHGCGRFPSCRCLCLRSRARSTTCSPARKRGSRRRCRRFVNALQDVANDPSSTASREALLSEARNLVTRLRCDGPAPERDRRRGSHAHGLGRGPRSRRSAASIAEINRQLIAAGTASGRPGPPELLDQRDRLLEELAGLVQVERDAAERRHDERVHRHGARCSCSAATPRSSW